MYYTPLTILYHSNVNIVSLFAIYPYINLRISMIYLMFKLVNVTLVRNLFINHIIKSIDLLDFKSYFRYYPEIKKIKLNISALPKTMICIVNIKRRNLGSKNICKDDFICTHHVNNTCKHTREHDRSWIYT